MTVPPIPSEFAIPQEGFPFQPGNEVQGLENSRGAIQNTNQGVWSFNFQNAPWVSVLRSFAKDAGFSVQFAAEPEGTFTYFDENHYTSSQVIDILNDHLLGSGCIVIRDGNRLTLINVNSPIPDSLIPFVSIDRIDSLGRNEMASVAIQIRNMNAQQAVEEIRELQSPVGQVKALSNSGRVIVTDTGSYLRRMRDLLLGSGIAAGDDQAFVYQVKHALADDVAKAITDFLNSHGTTNISMAADSHAGASSSTGGSPRVVAEKTTNSLLVRGSSEEMTVIQRLIADLDRAPRQVLVQALLVEVELGNTNELGIELGFQDSVLFDRSVVDKLVTISQTTTAPNGTQTTNQNIVSQTAAPGFNFNGQPLGNNVSANPGRVGTQGLANFGVGRVNGDLGFGGLVLSAGSESVNILLRALDAHFNIDVLSRPQVRAVENHQAFIQIGQQVPVVDGVTVTPVGSANPVIRQDQAGIILKVTPRISPDGRVQLDVNAEKSAFNLTPGSGVPIFTDATNGNVIEAPIKNITTADTTVSVQSGQTIVLGGMITNDQTIVTRKVPWLGDIPLLGRLFRYDLNRHKRKELLVFLTPTVLEDGHHEEFLKSQEVAKINMPAEAWSFGDNLSGTYFGNAGTNGLPTHTSGPGSGSPSTSEWSPAIEWSPAMSDPQQFGSGHSGMPDGNPHEVDHGAGPYPVQPIVQNRTVDESDSDSDSDSSKSWWRRSPNFRGPQSSKARTAKPAAPKSSLPVPARTYQTSPPQEVQQYQRGSNLNGRN